MLQNGLAFALLVEGTEINVAESVLVAFVHLPGGHNDESSALFLARVLGNRELMGVLEEGQRLRLVRDWRFGTLFEKVEDHVNKARSLGNGLLLSGSKIGEARSLQVHVHTENTPAAPGQDAGHIGEGHGAADSPLEGVEGYKGRRAGETVAHVYSFPA